MSDSRSARVGGTAVMPSKRDEILRHSARLFAEKGFDATSVEEICQACGIGRGLIYHYFKGKEEILQLVSDRVRRPLSAKFEEIHRQGGPAREVLSRISLAYLTTMSAHPNEAIVWGRETRALQSDPAYWGEVQAPTAQHVRRIEDVIQRGVDEGDFRQVDVKMVALAWRNLHDHTYTWIRQDGRLPVEKISEIFVSLFLEGVAIPSDREPGAVANDG